jgi:hypothetical protein
MMAAEGNLDDGCRCRFSVACLDGFAKESWMDEGEEKKKHHNNLNSNARRS